MASSDILDAYHHGNINVIDTVWVEGYKSCPLSYGELDFCWITASSKMGYVQAVPVLLPLVVGRC